MGAPKEWRGRFFEDFEVGDVHRSRIGRTVTDADNSWITCVASAHSPMHLSEPYARGTRYGRPLVYSAVTLGIVGGLSVPDTSENAAANLAFGDVSLPRPVFVGDTLWAESEILATRESASRPEVGIVSMRTRGINQCGEVVIQYLRTFMAYRRGAEAVRDTFPTLREPWSG